MSKGPPREGQTRASITIAALFFHQRQDHGILSDFRCDFNRHHNKSLQVLEAESKSIRVCALTGSVDAAVKTPRACPVFAKLDSCGAVGATSLPGGFFGMSADVRFSVNGINTSNPFVNRKMNCSPPCMNCFPGVDARNCINSLRIRASIFPPKCSPAGPSSHTDTFGARDFVSPQQKNGRTVRGDVTDHPWPSAGDPKTKKSLRERLRDARVARRKKKIPRRVVISVLKGRFRPYHLKYGMDVPGAYRFAHAKSKGTEYSDIWRKEESEEIGYLTGLDAFIKGLKLEDLPDGVTKDQVLGTLWAHDAKPKPRARLVADGSQEDTTGVDTFSPVLKLGNVKVVLAVIAQERMELRMIDIKKGLLQRATAPSVPHLGS